MIGLMPATPSETHAGGSHPPRHPHREIKTPELEQIELRLLLEAIHDYYGFDFRQYAMDSLRRRVGNFLRHADLTTISGLQDKILHDRESMERFLQALTVNVSSMFRDPEFFLFFRTDIVPMLKTWPLIRIWCAGCSGGEEAYSMAILLEEEGVYDRCRIYATDINEAEIRRAREGIFPAAVMQEYTHNYHRAGGERPFSDYYVAAYDHVLMTPKLRRNIIFAPHNLAMDASFNEFQAILCRNAMIYFARPLQDRVHHLFHSSLCHQGVLCLGKKENLRFSACERNYRDLGGNNRVYQKIS